MPATHLHTDTDGVVHYFCEHHAPKDAMKIGDVAKRNWFKIYWPLLAALGLILAYVALRMGISKTYPVSQFMNDFMAGFFLVFSILELNTYESFQETFRKYDLIAQKYHFYAQIYPIVLLFFGIFLHFNSLTIPISVLTIVLFGIQTYGIIQILKKGEKIQCACLGTKFVLPLSWVTVAENVIMILMALGTILMKFI